MKRVTGIDPTGSSFDRIAACAASAALPQVFDGGPAPYRDRGIALHGFLDAVAKLRVAGVELATAREQALADVDEAWRPVAAQVDLEQLGDRTTLSSEVALAYNWKADTARVLQPIAHRQYEIDVDTEVAFTLDVIGVDQGERVGYVGDYKGPFAWLPDPARSLQLGAGVLAIARIYRLRRGVVEHIRLRSDGTAKPFVGHLDVFAIDEVANRIGGMMRDVEQLRAAIDGGAVPNVTEGPWCQGCKATMHCPAKTQLVRSVLEQGGVKLSLREPITPANAGSVYAMVKKAEQGLAIARKALVAYESAGEPTTERDGVMQVAPTAIPVGTEPDGSLRYWGRFERPGNEKLDGAITLRVLTAKYGAELAAKACEVETSKTAIEDLVRANLKEGEKLGATKDAIIDEIRAAGGTARAKTDKPTEFTVSADGTVKAARKKKAS